jgi:6-pyruvoyltetrahydropterin/6-carboxytetrahydropterin synthase
MYELTVDSHFSSAHCLAGYKGKCANLHGHTWVVSATVRANELDEIGICIDFKKIAGALDEIVDRFDHQTLNSLPEFNGLNPTAENISRIVFEQLSATLNTGSVEVVSVTVAESDRYRVTYSKKATHER